MFDNAIYERDDEMGWIKGLKSNAEENSFLVKAKFGKTRTIMDDLVVIADECLENGNFRKSLDSFSRTQECIQNRPFYIGSAYSFLCMYLISVRLDSVREFFAISEKEASLKDLSSGWTWNDGQNIAQTYWNNKCLNSPYEPVLRRQAVIGQSYPNGEKMFDFYLKIESHF